MAAAGVRAACAIAGDMPESMIYSIVMFPLMYLPSICACSFSILLYVVTLCEQVYNHNFYWNSLSPWSGGEPTGAIKDAILAEYGSFEYFKEVFSSYASGHFGSGWTWLVQTADGSVTVSYELPNVS